MAVSVFRSARFPVAAMAALLLGASPAAAQNKADLKGQALMDYLRGQSYPPNAPTPPHPAETAAHVYPQRSTVHIYPLPEQHPAPDMRAYVMAHLPQGAELLIDGEVMVAHAEKPVYELRTPPLETGKAYHYTARVRWYESGQWVTQTHAFSYKVGDIHCIEITPNKGADAEKEIAAAMAALAADDRTAAEAQKFCAVQDTIRLGSMGTPVKVAVGGKDVFLCCPGCKAAALKDPAKIAATADKNKVKAVADDKSETNQPRSSK